MAVKWTSGADLTDRQRKNLGEWFHNTRGHELYGAALYAGIDVIVEHWDDDGPEPAFVINGKAFKYCLEDGFDAPEDVILELMRCGELK